MNITDQLAYLYGLERLGIKMGLEHTDRLLSRCGDPHKKIKSIQIAGTNGKGSTAAFLNSILQRHGVVTGLYTSPHLAHFNERIRMNGAPMSDEAIRRAEVILNELWPDLEEHIIRKEPYGAKAISGLSRDSVLPGCGGEAVGLAQVVGQVGASKPDARTPLSGLYIVGCDAGGRGAGTHQAVDSGFNVAAMVDADLG